MNQSSTFATVVGTYCQLASGKYGTVVEILHTLYITKRGAVRANRSMRNEQRRVLLESWRHSQDYSNHSCEFLHQVVKGPTWKQRRCKKSEMRNGQGAQMLIEGIFVVEPKCWVKLIGTSTTRGQCWVVKQQKSESQHQKSNV